MPGVFRGLPARAWYNLIPENLAILQLFLWGYRKAACGCNWPLTCKFSLYSCLGLVEQLLSIPPVVLGWWNLWKKEELILWPCGLFAKIPTWTWTLSRRPVNMCRDGLVKKMLTKLVVLGFVPEGFSRERLVHGPRWPFPGHLSGVHGCPLGGAQDFWIHRNPVLPDYEGFPTGMSANKSMWLIRYRRSARSCSNERPWRKFAESRCH